MNKQEEIKWTMKFLKELENGNMTLQTLQTLPDSQILSYLQGLVEGAVKESNQALPI
jgi:hypothetical protein